MFDKNRLEENDEKLTLFFLSQWTFSNKRENSNFVKPEENTGKEKISQKV